MQFSNSLLVFLDEPFQTIFGNIEVKEVQVFLKHSLEFAISYSYKKAYFFTLDRFDLFPEEAGF